MLSSRGPQHTTSTVIWGSPDYAELSIVGAMRSAGLCGVEGTALRQVVLK